MLHLAARRAGVLRRRGPVVRDAVRPRLADHGDRRRWPSTRPMAEQTLRVLAAPARPRATTPSTTRSPARSCTSCASARSRGAASRRWRATTARSTPRRCSCACSSTTPTGPATWTLFRELRDEVEAMLDWIDGPGDRDGDGLLEYQARTPAGLRNQGWKDSDDGDRRRARRAARAADHAGRAAGLRAARQARAGAAVAAGGRSGARGARSSARRPTSSARLERFWLPERGHYSMALGPDGRPSGALASNQGHLLWAGAVTPERAQAIRDALMGDRDVLRLGHPHAGRGRAGLQPGRLPPRHGLAARHGDDRRRPAPLRLRRGLHAGASRRCSTRPPSAERYRLPELFAGFGRTEFETPVPYPVACQPQAWAAGAIPYLGRAALGLEADGLRNRLRIRRPSLTRWLNRVEVQGLRIAGSRGRSPLRARERRRRRARPTCRSRATSRSCSRSLARACRREPAVPGRLERPARADRPRLHAVGDRHGAEPPAAARRRRAPARGPAGRAPRARPRARARPRPRDPPHAARPSPARSRTATPRRGGRPAGRTPGARRTASASPQSVSTSGRHSRAAAASAACGSSAPAHSSQPSCEPAPGTGVVAGLERHHVGAEGGADALAQRGGARGPAAARIQPLERQQGGVGDRLRVGVGQRGARHAAVGAQDALPDVLQRVERVAPALLDEPARARCAARGGRGRRPRRARAPASRRRARGPARARPPARRRRSPPAGRGTTTCASDEP